MAVFWKLCGGVLLTVVLVLAVGKQERDIAMVLTMAVCCLTAMAAVQLLSPVMDFLLQLERLTGLGNGVLKHLLKIVGIGLVTEVAGLICQDAGNASLGKSLQLLGTAMILQLSLPIFQTLLDLIQSILGEL